MRHATCDMRHATESLYCWGLFLGTRRADTEAAWGDRHGSGYTGGENDHPTYENHPGHAEALKVVYDDEKIDYKRILDFFFQIHNPTTLNRQGNNLGTSYRSAIFFQSEEEKRIAVEMITIVNDSRRWTGSIVTTLELFKRFWPAEEVPRLLPCRFSVVGLWI